MKSLAKATYAHLRTFKLCIISFTATRDVRILFRVLECLIEKEAKRE